LVKIRTRQFAKRQMTWFRRQMRLRWFRFLEGQSAEAMAEQLAREMAWLPAKHAK
jgi:tRNA A37 N6-isopentenylltransferase MiaA